MTLSNEGFQKRLDEKERQARHDEHLLNFGTIGSEEVNAGKGVTGRACFQSRRKPTLDELEGSEPSDYS